MNHRSFTRLICAGALALFCAAGEARAQTTADAQQVIDQARVTVQEMRSDRAFGNAPELLRRARAIMIVPSLVKGGFFVGGEGGQGVLLERTARGWSLPAFYTLGAGSFGLQIGLEQARVVMLVMTDRALQAWLQDQFTLGARAGFAVVNIGSNVGANGTTALDGADIILWSKSRGAFAGLTLEGSVIRQRHELDQAYYGRETTSEQVFASRTNITGAGRLRAVLSR